MSLATIAKGVCVYAAGFGAAYLAGAFFSASPNIAEWSADARFFTALIGTLCGCGALAAWKGIP